MLAAQAFEVVRDGQPASRRILMVERNGVVEVADNGRPAASGEAAGEIAAPNRSLQRRGRLVAQGLDRTRHRIGDEDGCGSSQLAHLVGVDDAVALHIARLCAVGMKGPVARHYVDDHLRPGRTIGVVTRPVGALRLPAGARQPATLGQGGQRVGPALIQCPRVCRAHLLGELREPPIKGSGGGGSDRPVDIGHPIVFGADSDMAVGLGGKAALAGGVGVGGSHGGVDGVDDSLLRPAVPVADAFGQRLVDLGDQFLVGHQIGSADDQAHCAPVRPALREQGRNPWQPGVQRLRVRHQVAGAHGGEVHRGGNLGSGLLEAVDRRVFARTLGPLGGGHPMPQQRRYRGHPAGHQHRFPPVRRLDHLDERSWIRHRFEHRYCLSA